MQQIMQLNKSPSEVLVHEQSQKNQPEVNDKCFEAFLPSEFKSEQFVNPEAENTTVNRFRRIVTIHHSTNRMARKETKMKI